jgi:hypothetical protein
MLTISDGRLNQQQQRRCGEEQKVFQDILPASEDLGLATDAAASWRFEHDLVMRSRPTAAGVSKDANTT